MAAYEDCADLRLRANVDDWHHFWVPFTFAVRTLVKGVEYMINEGVLFHLDTSFLNLAAIAARMASLAELIGGLPNTAK